MSSPPNVHTGLVKKMTLQEAATKVREINGIDKDANDSDVAATYFNKFPDDVAKLDPQSRKLAQGLLDGGADGIRAFYNAFGQRVMKDVELKNAPAFVQKALTQESTQYRFGDAFHGNRVGHVNSPRAIFIDKPLLFNAAAQAHEATHVYQGTLRHSPTPDPEEQKGGHANYDYGGWAGLIEARRRGRTINDFTDEQQAQMVDDYVNLQQQLHSESFQNHAPIVQQGMLERWDQANQALAPYLRQLAGQPKMDDPEGDIFHPEKLDLKPPPPPGPPPAALTGTAVPLPEIGGTSVYTALGKTK